MDFLILAGIVLALLFNFVNGMNDATNSIATVVATRVLSPLKAVAMAAFFNMIGPLLFTTAVAKTIGKGIVDPVVPNPLCDCHWNVCRGALGVFLNTFGHPDIGNACAGRGSCRIRCCIRRH